MKKIHADIKIYGIVQGVGFRPFVHREVSARSLSGTVRNTSYGALLTLEGSERAIDGIITTIRENPPPLAFVEKVEAEISEALSGFSDFRIIVSDGDGERLALISPDVATCDDCLSELFDADDRRYRFPFINCTNCGPRFTITRDIPYDRKNTTMQPFPMCGECESEYNDIEDRRYHAQPDCCGECGPRLFFYADGKEVCGDCIALATEYIRDGKIVAIKGLGGYHLACRCDEETVSRLRKRKRRDEKPFAIMCRDVTEARRWAEISPEEEKHLTSRARPIVLLRKRARGENLYLSGNGYIGIMLPYTPVHHLLMREIPSLVMTSANISDLPIIYNDDAAMRELSDVADAFLINNRDIFVRCDDSLMWVFRGREYFARRSRGYVPHPVCTERELPAILACGAEQKASFSISRGGHVFPSQHIGDLKNLETLENYEAQISHFERIFDIDPEILVCDRHPDYLSTEYAEERAKREGKRLVRVYHHHAHMASCMADNGYDGKCIGIVWDGTGLGDDGKSNGAEFLAGDFSEYRRLGTIFPIPLAGGDRATKEISRIGNALLMSAGLPCDERVRAQIEAGINCPQVTGMGRLFDGVSAILGICETASYEGQGAILLEACAEEGISRTYDYAITNESGMYVFDWRGMISEIVSEKQSGISAGEIAATFMNTLVVFAVDMTERISRDTGIKTAALSGGSFQNMYVLNRLASELESRGITTLTHRRVSCNDEGISLGQLHIAEAICRGNSE